MKHLLPSSKTNAVLTRRLLLGATAAFALLGALASTDLAVAQAAKETLIVAGPRTPESLDQEYPPTEAVHEMRRNVYERLLAYEMKPGEDGILYEDFSKITGALAEKWEPSTGRRQRCGQSANRR